MKRLVVFVASMAAGTVCAENAAHTHGVVQLDIAQEGSALEVILESPAANFLGWEHAPKSQEDRQQVAALGKQLKMAASVFSVPESAGCRVVSAELDNAFFGQANASDKHAEQEDEHQHDDHHDNHHEEDRHKEEHHEEAHHDAHEHDDDHSEFSVHYRMDCQGADPLGVVNVHLFSHFPAIETVVVQAVTEHGQKGARLNSSNAQLVLKN